MSSALIEGAASEPILKALVLAVVLSLYGQLAILLALSAVVVGVWAGFEARQERSVRGLLTHLLAGSFAVGVLYVFAEFLFIRPSAWNLTWILGIPFFVAFVRRPRPANLTLIIPLVFGGWITFALIAWTFRLPIGY